MDVHCSLLLACLKPAPGGRMVGNGEKIIPNAIRIALCGIRRHLDRFTPA
jgi:hypothetical protein